MNKGRKNIHSFDRSSKIGQDNYRLILLNDDEILFEYVIDCLVEVCKFDYQKAEQCTLLAHFNGEYPIMSGNKDILEQIQKMLYFKKINTKLKE